MAGLQLCGRRNVFLKQPSVGIPSEKKEKKIEEKKNVCDCTKAADTRDFSYSGVSIHKWECKTEKCHHRLFNRQNGIWSEMAYEGDDGTTC